MSRSRILLRFLVLGGCLFLLDRGRLWLESRSSDGPRVGVTSSRSPAALEEVLVGEALALGLDQSDPVVQRRLRQNGRFVGEEDQRLLRQMRATDPVVRRRLVQRMKLRFEAELPVAEPTDEEIAETYRAERDRFFSAERVRVRHIFFDGARGTEAEVVARRTRVALVDGSLDENRSPLGDPFPDGEQLPPQSPEQLSRRFGDEISRRLLTLPLGSWSEPLRSPYGIHLLRVEERQPAHLLPLEEVREVVRLQLIARTRATAAAAVADQLLAARESRLP